MSKLKLFGNRRTTSKGARVKSATPRRSTKGARAKKTWNFARFKDIFLAIFALLILFEGVYLFCLYSDNAFVSKWRNIYIQTAMSTMTHQWLATAFIPDAIIQEVMDNQAQSLQEAIGVESQWFTPIDTNGPDEEVYNPLADLISGTKDLDEASFYDLFWELDQDTMEDYLDKNPGVLANGWNKIKINEAGLDDDGTSIYTTMGEQVLALDAENQILLVRVEGAGYRGVLAIAKDPSKLSVENSAGLGSYGQTAGDIATANGGLLAMTGSGFIDEDGVGNGGILAGYSMSNGVSSDTAHMGWTYKRLELREDNRMYIVDAQSSVHSDTTDAVEFTPAIIVDGETMSSFNDYTAMNPRAAIGQSKNEEILMLVIEGRLVTSLGIDVEGCAKIFEQHNAMQAMNLDGGTSAIMWYDGEYVTQCSNTAIPEGRTLPNAFVYG